MNAPSEGPVPRGGRAGAGVLAFARFAYPPNAVGACGADDPAGLLEQVAAEVVDGGLRERAAQFQGAWPYLRLIAAANRLDDPLDHRVVAGYWLGEEAARAVRLRPMADHVRDRFARRAGGSWGRLAALLDPEAVPDHAFHVLAVYPWVGLLREGVTEPSLDVITSCLVRPARVTAVRGDRLDVSVPRLAWDGRRLRLGSDVDGTLTWSRQGHALVEPPRPGHLVAAHWDWACHRITPAQAVALRSRIDAQARRATA